MYVGIDVSKGKSRVCIIDAGATVLHEFGISHTKKGFQKLEWYLTKESKIGMETTGSYSKTLYYWLKGRYDVFYVDTYQMHAYAKLHNPTIKNDKADAKLIAEYVKNGMKKIETPRVNHLKDLARLYFKVARQLARQKCMFKSELAVVFPELEKHFSTLNVKALPNLLLKYPTPKGIALADDQNLLLALKSKVQSGKMHSMKTVHKIKQLAEDSVGVKNYPTDYFKYTIKLLLFYQDLKQDIVDKMENYLLRTPYKPLLKEFGYSVKSMGLIIGEVHDIRRFENHKKFVKYCGLDVTEETSGTSVNRQSYISKKGSSQLRSILYNMVLVHLAYKTPFSEFFYRLKEQGKHPKLALTALTRKMAIKVYHDMKHCHKPNSSS